MGDAWHVKPAHDGSIPTLLANSTLDDATIEAITSGKKPFPNYGDVPLTPQRRLLHEVIIQAVTERKINHDPNHSYEEQLATAVEKAVHNPAYQTLSEKGTFSHHDVAALLDSAGLEHLPAVPANQRTTVMMATGGPATGKSDIVAALSVSNPDIYRNAAQVNADDYKLLLASKHQYGAGYANAAHAESGLLTDEITARLSQQMDVGRAPNVLMDVVTLNDQRMAFAKKSGQLIVATGTAPPETTIERAYQRGERTGRVVPSEAVLAGAKVVAQTTPLIFEHPNVKMELFDTNVPFGSPHKLVAEWIPHASVLSIHEPDTFIDFVERQNLNTKAHNASELFRPEDRTPARIAEGMKAYTDKGVTLAFLDKHGDVAMIVGRDGVQQVRPLESQRGNAFFAELAGAATTLAGNRTVSEPQRMPVQEPTSAEISTPQNGKGTPQNPLPILLSPHSEKGMQQTPLPLLLTNTTPQPRLPSPEIPPKSIEIPRGSLPKIGIGGAAVQLAIGPAFEATLAAANDGNAHDIAKAGLHGLANSALPGVTDGFKNITQNNKHQNWIDQTLNAGTTATQGVAVGALAVAGGATVAAPVTGGASLTVTAGSLVVAGVSGIANLGIGLVHDVTYVTGASKQGGLITGVIGMAGQLANSKAAHRTGDWFMGNDAKVQHELAAKGIKHNQLAAVDENKDGTITAQETRDYLIQHHVAAAQVNSLPAQALADKLASVLTTEVHAQTSAHQPAHQSLSPDMLRALGAAKAACLSTAIHCDSHGLSSPLHGINAPAKQHVQGAVAGR